MQFIRRSLGTQALMIAVIVIGLYFGYSFAREVVQAERLSNEAAISTKANDALAEANRKLERDLQYYQSDEYAELRARTDLNMRMPDEQVILPVLPQDEQDQQQVAVAAATPVTATVATVAQPAQPGSATAGAVAAPQRNWDRWIALFTSMWH